MKPGAAIIGTSSETGIMGSKELPDYSATKGAMNAFIKTLAQNVLERGIMRDAPAPTRSFDAQTIKSVVIRQRRLNHVRAPGGPHSGRLDRSLFGGERQQPAAENIFP